uniref:Uncharacterized protein n=1 Tax=Coptotermes formosanus TaxID=36987 RepID=R4V4V8_COPFO|nr:hypothetical protein [Coptotermes formosanus]
MFTAFHWLHPVTLQNTGLLYNNPLSSEVPIYLSTPYLPFQLLYIFPYILQPNETNFPVFLLPYVLFWNYFLTMLASSIIVTGFSHSKTLLVMLARCSNLYVY